jgi:hypothetical protein
MDLRMAIFAASSRLLRGFFAGSAFALGRIRVSLAPEMGNSTGLRPQFF